MSELRSEQLMKLIRERREPMEAEHDVEKATTGGTEAPQNISQSDECAEMLQGPKTNMRYPRPEELKLEWTACWDLFDPFTRLALIHICQVEDKSLFQIVNRALYSAVSENHVLRSHRRQLNWADAEIEEYYSRRAQWEAEVEKGGGWE